MTEKLVDWGGGRFRPQASITRPRPSPLPGVIGVLFWCRDDFFPAECFDFFLERVVLDTTLPRRIVRVRASALVRVTYQTRGCGVMNDLDLQSIQQCTGWHLELQESIQTGCAVRRRRTTCDVRRATQQHESTSAYHESPLFIVAPPPACSLTRHER